MSRYVRNFFISTILVALAAGSAFADSHETAPAGGDEASSDYPLEIILRPLVLPKGAWQAGFDYSALKLTIGDASETFGAVTLSGSYGVMDKLEVGVAIPIAVQPDFQEDHAHFSLGAGYQAYAQGKIEVVAALIANLDFDAEHAFAVGQFGQFTLNDKMAVVWDTSLNIAIDGGLDDDGMPATAMTLPIDLGFGYQAAPNIYAQLNTTVATIAVANAGDTTTLGDFINLNLAGAYSLSNLIDVGAQVGTADAENFADFITFGVFARYRGGL